jgi:hypothetical protein
MDNLCVLPEQTTQQWAHAKINNIVNYLLSLVCGEKKKN